VATRWNKDRPNFGSPATELRGKTIFATGKIEQFRGAPEITATKPEQIKPQP
jgi:DNA/RNA endonuclease YhcR with UshA esterase domain